MTKKSPPMSEKISSLGITRKTFLLSLGGLAGLIGAFHYFSNPQNIRKNTVWTAVGEYSGDSFGSKVAPAGDVNGDGFADAAVWSSGFNRSAGKIYVYLGSAQGLSPAPAWSTPGESKGQEYGHSFGGVGDVNGDGFGDFIVAAQNFGLSGKSGVGRAYLYLGSRKGLNHSPAWTKTGDAPGDLFGDCSGPAGDVNHDGLGDVIIGAYGYDHSRGSAYLFHGSKTGALSQSHSWKGAGEAVGDWYGYSVSSAGDVNHDGFPDLVFGAKMARQDKSTHAGKAYAYYGGENGYPPTPSWSAGGEGEQNLFGWRAVSAGDINGDGFSDVVVGAYLYSGPAGSNCGKVYLFNGSSAGLSAQPSWTKTGEMAGAFLGKTVASGDFDQDGYSDILVGTPGFRPKGRVYLFKGGPHGLASSPAWTLESPEEADLFGEYTSNTGDINGDGFPDVLVGAPYGSNPNLEGKTGKAYLYFGRKNGELHPTAPR